MTVRYLALIYTNQARRQARARSLKHKLNFQTQVDLDCATVLADGAKTCVELHDHAGVVLGSLFAGLTPPVRKTEFSPRESDLIRRRGAAELFHTYWGGYISVIEGWTGASVSIVRDPSGAVPVYYTADKCGYVIASEVETLLASGVANPSIDWTFVANHIHHFDVATPKTALAGISELLPGFSLTIRATVATPEQVWSPWDYVKHTAVVPDRDLQAQLRGTIAGTTAALASGYERILLGLSGGFDSSVTAATLARQSTPWLAFTMATDEPTGDERRYARQMTEHLGTELHEHFHDLKDVNMAKAVSAHLPRPTARSFGQSQNAVVHHLMTRFACDTHFTGTGGDNVFCYLSSATPILDRFMTEGFSLGVWETAQDICRLTGCSIWEALHSAYARSKHPAPKWGNPEPNKYLKLSSLTEGYKPRHPWLDLPETYLPGKAVHIAMLARAHGVMTTPPVSAGFDYVMPLVAQPVVELCLSIPSWKWCQGGMNRALARDAFKDWLPASLIGRRSKGGPSRFCHDVIETQRMALQEYLLDGLLATKGIIDTDALGEALSGRKPMDILDHLDISQFAEAESWARHWSK